MKSVNLIELSSMESFGLSSLFVMKQIWSDGRVFVMEKPRRQNALLWFCGATGVFKPMTGGAISASVGDIVLIPQGSEYSVEFGNCIDTTSTVLIEFCLTAEEPLSVGDGITVLEKKQKDSDVIEAVLRLATLYAMPSRPWLEIRSCFFTLLSSLASREESRYIGKRGLSTVEKGIRYLQVDDEQKLSLDEVAAMCYVSPAYFRRMFRIYSGMSPSRYRTVHKIAKAEELLANSDLSIDEISARLGFDNPSYFCRVFKKEKGVAPTVYRKTEI